MTFDSQSSAIDINITTTPDGREKAKSKLFSRSPVFLTVNP